MQEKPSHSALVVDDERPIRRFLRTALGESWNVLEAETGMDGLQQLATAQPDVMLLDLSLPDLDGLEVLRRAREWTETPIIILSIQSEEIIKAQALDAGADDYLTKPFGITELMARMRAALRHASKVEAEPIYQSGKLMVNLAFRQVFVNETQINLTPIEYQILRTLVQNAGRVLTSAQLIRAVWETSAKADNHLLRVNVSNLRRKIEPDPLRPRHIITEPGVGYRLVYIEENL